MPSPARRLFSLGLALCGLAACASPETTVPPGSASSTGFDAQAWLIDARAVTFSIESADLDDTRIDRMKQLADALDAETSYRRPRSGPSSTRPRTQA